MKRSYILLIINFLFALMCCVDCFAQNDVVNEIQNVKSGQDLFDERGYSKNGSNNGNGVNISNVNGSLGYSYTISETPVADGKLTLTMNYCNAVSFKSFSYWMQFKDGNNQFWKTFTVNKPLWILGLNGFAIQTSSHANRFSNYLTQDANTILDEKPVYNCETPNESMFINKLKETNAPKDSSYWNSSYNLDLINPGGFVWLIEGYDYCNKLEYEKVTPDAANRDEISILKADGSILKLKNLKGGGAKVGKYIDFGANNDAYAIVDSINSTRTVIWNKYLSNFLGQGNNQECGGNDSNNIKKYINYPQNYAILSRRWLRIHLSGISFSVWIRPIYLWSSK